MRSPHKLGPWELLMLLLCAALLCLSVDNPQPAPDQRAKTVEVQHG